MTEPAIYVKIFATLIGIFTIDCNNIVMFAKTTLNEIGRQIGVSASTVSRVLNGVAGVNEGTRRKVLAAVQQLNYGKTGTARHDSRGSRLIGFLMPAEAEQWGLRTNFTEQG